MQRSSPAGKHSTIITAVALVLAVIVAGALGCGRDAVLGPSGPVTSDASSPADAAGVTNTSNPAGGVPSPAEAVLETPGESPASFDVEREPMIWSEVAGDEVDAESGGKVTGSRYTLTFDKYSLEASTWITIKERNPGVADVELGPDGLKFASPVLLEIDYASTANDPKAPDYNGLPPRLFWYNPDEKTWTAMPGTDDPEARVYRVWLKHFSRYAMGDGAGWDPRKHNHGVHHDEIQWY
jgi:hypothetical protein